ncbi:MAG: acyl--CoA ligase [Firmicutes bacterium]|nr:acyl--CoA ligase [Bacillota bacterium]
MVITDFLERNAREFGDDICLVEVNPERKESRRVTWREYELIESTSPEYYRNEISWQIFDEKANRFANLLLSRGVKKGDKIAILLMNCLEWLPIYFGILKTGALAVPLNFRYTSEEIKYCINKADVNILVFGPEFIGRVEAISEEISKTRLLYFVGENCPSFAEDYSIATSNCSSRKPNIILDEKDDAAIYFSSGTTGFPKAILHNHESLAHSCRTEQAHHGQTRDDVFLCIPPLYHTGAKMHWFGSLLAGSKAVLLKGTSPDVILETASKEKCTIVWLLVPWAQDILTSLDLGKLKLSDYELTQWRLMHIGAQPVPQSLIRRWFEYFPDHQYDTNYGLSESIGPGCVHLGVENPHKVGAIGIPGYGWEVRIVDEDFCEVPKGHVGELAVKGPGVMTCYYNDPEASAAVLRGSENEWLLTGDVAQIDEDGFIWLVDRAKDVIISGGENIYPVQIEDFLSAHPKIKDVAVIGLADDRLGEIVAAIIESIPGVECTEDEINEFCKQLPRYKRPRKLIFADVPRNPTGKIEKPKLREMYGAVGLVAQQNKA